MFFQRKITDNEQLNICLENGIIALVELQQKDGSFPLFQRNGRGKWFECHPLFSTLTVLLASGSLLPEQSVSRAAEFILSSRRDDGTWVFDPDLGIPPDSDDTACALAVIARYDKNYKVYNDVDILRSFWRQDGGPFRTWQADGVWDKRDRDDAVVNCNIILALKTLGELPSDEEIKAVVRLIHNSTEGCRYYTSPLTIGYAAVRAGIAKSSLPDDVTRRPRSSWGVLPTAQWLSITRRWDVAALRLLVNKQIGNGCWPAEKWFTAVGYPTPVWGCPALSTALCVEALNYVINQ